MKKIGIITEKSSAQELFADAFGGIHPVYDGSQLTIVHSVGHIFESIKPGEQDSTLDPADVPDFKSWDLARLPWDASKLSWKRQIAPRVASVANTIKAELRDCDEIVIACDIDPTGEGDLIGVEIIEELGLIKPGRSFSRMYFVDEKPASLKKAFANRKTVSNPLDLPDFRKAFYRARFDLLSMQWTRVATDCCNGVVVRHGRLKTAIIQLIGDQLAAHNAYVKKPFYRPSFVDDHGVRYFDKDAPNYETADEVPMDYSDSAVVVDSKKEKRTAPPALMTLGKLSAKLAPKGVGPDVVLATYQKMYEAKVLSYPRTDDKTITHEQFNEMLPLVDTIANLVGADVSKLTHRVARSTHVKDVGAHGANRPGVNVPSSLDNLDTLYGKGAKLIYELLARNFLAMFAEDYVYEAQVGHIEKYPSFIGRASVPKSLGFKDIFVLDEDDADDDEMNQGLGSKASPEVYEGVPPRPVHPNMDWLEDRLARENIGTGSTRTSTLKEVLIPEQTMADRKAGKKPDPNNVLVKNAKGKLSLGTLGEYSYALVPGTHIGDLSLTKLIQDNMKLIAEGTLDPEAALAGVGQLVAEDMATMKKNAVAMQKTMTLPERRVGGEIVKGAWNGTEVGLRRNVFDHELTDAELQSLFNGETIEFEAKAPGKPKSKHRMSIQKYTFKGEERTGLRYVTKERDANGLPVEFGGYKFTSDELTRLASGEKVSFKDAFVWESNRATGKKSSATIYFDKKTKKYEFAKGVPDEFGGYRFTDAEKARLDAGEEVVFGEVFLWGANKASGKKSSATLVYNKKTGRLDFVRSPKKK